MITKENISFHELIGLNAAIVKSNDKQMVGFVGKIIDETKYMFTLRTGSCIKKIPKGTARWKFDFNGQTATVEGSELISRPYERIGMKT
ncbi:MAG: ribonuclease P protein subunit [Thaumarchaeota archaeon]|nr:MAG: ribonuclease P protein subunit [Nitrososphaerota archaeon]